MRNIYIIIFCSLALLSTACRKNSTAPALPDGSVGFQVAAGTDTMVVNVSVLTDSAVVVGLKAQLSGATSSAGHIVSFAVDTTKINNFNAKYGNVGVLLPASSYFVYKSMTQIAPGASLSDSAIINIVKETGLNGYTSYVLPIVIQLVDGKPDGPATTKVLYVVIRTGKPAFISKTGWTIGSFSSSYSTFAPANVLDADNVNTYWTSNITLTMPQWMVINFNTLATFSAVNYYVPALLKYPTQGGYPTSIQIETSMDGTTWVSDGIFAGNIGNNMQTLTTGLVTGRYLRFTVLSCVKYASTYSCIFISGISLLP